MRQHPDLGLLPKEHPSASKLILRHPYAILPHPLFIPASLFSRYNAYSYLGTDLPETVPSGRSQNNVFSQNTFVAGQESIKIKEADGTQFLDNTFEDAAVVRFDNATMNLMQGNTGLEEAELKVDNGACFDGESDSDYEPVC